MEPDEICDEIYELLDGEPPHIALQALTAVIMGMAGRCVRPHRALLGVIAELTDLVRFVEIPHEERETKALSHQDWVEATWQELEGEAVADTTDEVSVEAEEGQHRREALANWTPAKGRKPQ